MERAAADAFFVREGSITLTPSLAFSLNCISRSFGHIPWRTFFEPYNPSSELALYALDRLDIIDLVWIPERAAVFHSGPYQGFVELEHNRCGPVFEYSKNP